MISQTESLPPKSFWPSLRAALVTALLLAGVSQPAFAASTGASSAYGESVSLTLVPVVGGVSPINSGPTPQVSGTAPPPYIQNASALSAAASNPNTGTILTTGLLIVDASSTIPTTNQALADAEVDNPGVFVTGNLQLLTLTADQITSSAQVSGTCGSNLNAVGSSVFTGARMGGALVPGGITIPVNPPPNTEIFNVAGIRVVLNEQVGGGNGTATSTLVVNALHVYLSNTLLTGLGLLTGDVVLSHSQAALDCNGLAAISDLSIAKSANPNPVMVGQNLTYTLTVSNNGPDAAADAVVVDTLPATVNFVSATPSQGSCSGTSSLSCSLGTIDSGASATVAIVVQPTQAGTIVNSASAASSSLDPNPGNNTASISTTVNPAGSAGQADVSITKVATPNPVVVGSDLAYTLTVSNSGPAAATRVMVSDTLPPSVVLASVTPSQGSCSGTTAILCTLGKIPPGGKATVTIIVHTTTIGDLVNTAVVSALQGDPNLGNNTATMTTHVTPPGGARQCRIDDVPAATLLVPFFAVDLASAAGLDTHFSVVNSGAAPRLASVTLWSDWAIPVLTFNVYLTGYDVQDFDLRNILLTGAPPATGSAASNRGPLSDPNLNFPGCDANDVAGPPVRPIFLQRALTGRGVLGRHCFSSPRSDSVATGYVTVDAVNACSDLNPSNPGYFGNGGTGVASDDNVLLGDYWYVDTKANFADGDAAVHITADAASFGAGTHTFYARYVGGNGSDNRQPLGTLYGARYLTSGLFSGTKLTVWRDTKSADAGPVDCGNLPSWAPLNAAAVPTWDEEENSFLLPSSADRLPWATQQLTAGSSALPLVSPAGWLWLDLSHAATPLFGNVAQGWVTVLHTSSPGRYTVGHRAWRLDSACDFQ